ncbi:MAG: hypothetical protein ABEH81_06940 [Halopenitus sp.]
MTREYDKLVRDAIPAIIEDDGEQPVVHTVTGAEYERRLDEKLAEEVAEYRDSRDVEELADILEVVHAIREQHGVSVEELQELRERKADERGRFDDGIVLERVVE